MRQVLLFDRCRNCGLSGVKSLTKVHTFKRSCLLPFFIFSIRDLLSRMMWQVEQQSPIKEAHVLTPNTYKYITLHGKQTRCNQRILRWEIHPGVSKSHEIIVVLIPRRVDCLSQRKHATTDAEFVGMRCQEPSHGDNIQELKGQENRFSPGASRRTHTSIDALSLAL